MIKKFLKSEKLNSFFNKHTILFCFVLALLVNLVMEMLCRHSLIGGIVHLFKSPQVFLHNSLAVFTLSLTCLFFKKRVFVLVLAIAPVFLLSLINSVALFFRATPLTASDFVELISVLGIFDVYLKWWAIAMIILVLLIIVAGFVVLWKKTGKTERRLVQGTVALPTAIIILTLTANAFLNRNYLSKDFKNLNDAYNDYGFVYCFSCSIFDTGIDRPADYSGEKVNTILTAIRAEEVLEPEEKPNVIFVQLESFFDVKELQSLKINDDPTPFFTSLKANYPHAYLEVPYIGSGTANVEFEILTGMSLDYFGPGEYPYKTVLQNNACESLAYNLKEIGYTAHAVHNHNATFYDRAHVFSNLGFDTFVSLEFMCNVTYNPIGWANDSVLTDEIISCLDSTSSQDLVYAITVQSHGIYSEQKMDGVDYKFDVEIVDKETGINETAFEYYLTQLNDTDDFVADLITELSVRDEKTVVVLYGDHLPYFELTDNELKSNSKYKTEYVIWSNYDLDAEAVELYSYELSAHVLKQLGMNNGLITKLHQNSARDNEYFASLEMLQYDMLYGMKECYGYNIKYTPSDLKMGVNPLKINSVKNTASGIEISGDMFTEFTRVKINGTKYDTEYINSHTVLVPNREIIYGDTISVVQTNGMRVIFDESAVMTYGSDSEYEEAFKK